MRPPDDTAQTSASVAARALQRRRNVLLAQHHRQQDWSIAQIAQLLDRAPATVRGYLHDPSGEKAKRRRAGYAGTCERCGAPTSGADGKSLASRHCQRCKPQSRARWTPETVRGAHRFWYERFGFIASSVDWSRTHARRRGGEALERYQSAHWPSQSVIRRLYGTPATARADAFAGLDPGQADAAAPAARRTPGRTRSRGLPREGPARPRDDAIVCGRSRAHTSRGREAATVTDAGDPIPDRRR